MGAKNTCTNFKLVKRAPSQRKSLMTLTWSSLKETWKEYIHSPCSRMNVRKYLHLLSICLTTKPEHQRLLLMERCSMLLVWTNTIENMLKNMEGITSTMQFNLNGSSELISMLIISSQSPHSLRSDIDTFSITKLFSCWWFSIKHKQKAKNSNLSCLKIC